MPTLPTPDARTLRAWEEQGIVPPGTLASLRRGDRTPKPARVAGAEIGPWRADKRKCGRGAVVTERQFQRAVIEFAVLNGWTVYSIPDSRRASAAGWPDLVCGKEGRGVVAAELKRVGQKPRAHQRWWLDRLTESGVPAFWWTPADWAEIERVLSHRGTV